MASSPKAPADGFLEATDETPIEHGCQRSKVVIADAAPALARWRDASDTTSTEVARSGCKRMVRELPLHPSGVNVPGYHDSVVRMSYVNSLGRWEGAPRLPRL